MLRSASGLLALLLLAAAAGAQAPPGAVPLAADTVAADTLAPPAPATPLDAALARVAQVRLPRGPFPALDARIAGVVWQMPDTLARAVDDLVAMRQAGVRAVRTGLVADTVVLRVASQLGIAIWQDLPVSGLPAAFLVRETPAAARMLAEALALARPYPAARHFGLARASDTSDPAARAYVARLTELAHAEGAPGTQTYVVTRFPESDRASRAADIVLLDARDAEALPLLARWRARHETPAGFAALGVGVRPGADGGWREPGTPFGQARTLETTLTDLLTLADPPVVTFLYRWRDLDGPADSRDQRAEVAGLKYGLIGADGEPRPSYDVARGFFTGTQRVFAFNAGATTEGGRRSSPLLLLGWGLALSLGLFYAGAPKLSALAPRYFGRRDLYREAVARGYDLSTTETTGLALVLSLTAGVVLASALRALGRTDALVAATASWAPEAQLRLTELLGQPLALMGTLALAHVAWLLFNVLWLNVISGRRRLRPAQALSLVVWSRWAWFPLMAVSLILAGVGAQTATLLAPAVLGLALLLETVACYRTMLDLIGVSNVSPVRALLFGFGVPFLLVAAGLIWLGVTAQGEVSFLFHLATRS